jgi:hypothetical protein
MTISSESFQIQQLNAVFQPAAVPGMLAIRAVLVDMRDIEFAAIA